MPIFSSASSISPPSPVRFSSLFLVLALLFFVLLLFFVPVLFVPVFEPLLFDVLLFVPVLELLLEAGFFSAASSSDFVFFSAIVIYPLLQDVGCKFVVNLSKGYQQAVAPK
jgi:hypothetical protein